MFLKIRSTISYKIAGILSLIATPQLLLLYIWLQIYGNSDHILIAILWFLCTICLKIVYIIFGITQVIEQFRIKQITNNLATDIGYIIGLLYILYVFIVYIYNSNNPPIGGMG